MKLETTGWRCWFDDGSTHTGLLLSEWKALAASRPTKCLIKMIYYDDGGKQIQQADWWYETQHESGLIRATCTDAQKSDIEALHPDAVFIEGFWTTDEWYRELVDAAMVSTYGG